MKQIIVGRLCVFLYVIRIHKTVFFEDDLLNIFGWLRSIYKLS